MEKQIQRDLEYFLPLRWAFHCYLTGGQWKFEEWREYLLNWEDWSAEDEVLAFQTDARFQWDALRFLEHNGVKSLVDFCKFNQRLEEEYCQTHYGDV